MKDPTDVIGILKFEIGLREQKISEIILSIEDWNEIRAERQRKIDRLRSEVSEIKAAVEALQTQGFKEEISDSSES